MLHMERGVRATVVLALATISVAAAPAPQCKGKQPPKVAHTSKPTSRQQAAKPAEEPWQRGVITQYAQYFQGRRQANGQPFDHAKLTCAMREEMVRRCGGFGTKIEIKYAEQKVIATLTDTGRLPLGKHQIDASQAVMRKLGCYQRSSRGGTDRRIWFRPIRAKPPAARSSPKIPGRRPARGKTANT